MFTNMNFGVVHMTGSFYWNNIEKWSYNFNIHHPVVVLMFFVLFLLTLKKSPDIITFIISLILLILTITFAL